MNDNRNELGSNWGSGTPRTLGDAFPMSPSRLEAHRNKWSVDALLMLAAVVFFVVVCVAHFWAK